MTDYLVLCQRGGIDVKLDGLLTTCNISLKLLEDVQSAPCHTPLGFVSSTALPSVTVTSVEYVSL
jgi:hypothetical protein